MASVQFYQESVKMGFLSEQAGHAVYEDRDFIRIHIPGDMSNIIEREATDKDKYDYASTYAKYKQGLEPSVDGIPLESWARLTKSQALNYKALGFMTVEQIAEMSDTACGHVGMGAMADRTAAKAFIEQAADSALAQKQALIIERQDADIAALKEQVTQLAALAEGKESKTITLKK